MRDLVQCRVAFRLNEHIAHDVCVPDVTRRLIALDDKSHETRPRLFAVSLLVESDVPFASCVLADGERCTVC